MFCDFIFKYIVVFFKIRNLRELLDYFCIVDGIHFVPRAAFKWRGGL